MPSVVTTCGPAPHPFPMQYIRKNRIKLIANRRTAFEVMDILVCIAYKRLQYGQKEIRESMLLGKCTHRWVDHIVEPQNR